MSEGKKACITGGVVALVVLCLALPLGGPATYKQDLLWVPNEKDPAVLAAYVEGETAVKEVDQLYPLQVLVEEEDYSAYFFHKVENGDAIATWLVRVPLPDETILKHQEKVIPHVGLRATDTTVEDGILCVPTEFDGGGIFGAIVISGLFFALVAALAYTIIADI